MNDTKRKLAAIVFTDIVGFTKLSSKNEPAALALLEKQRDLLQPIVEKNNGDWLKEIGDGLLLTFETTRDAVDCGIEIQHATKNIPDLDLRIGIHQGEVVFQGSDVVGDDVNIASRIEPFAATGGIAISGRVNSSLERDPEFETMLVGTPHLKGVSQKVEVYCIVSHNLPKTDVSKVQAKIENKGFQWNLLSISGAALTLIGLLFWINLSFIGIGIADTNEVLSVAVLPFENKGEKKDDFYAYGISSDLIKDVSSTGMLRVAALADIEKLDYLEMNNDELADKLRVRYVAKGTLWKMDSVFQLSMELFDTKNSKVVWSNRWQTNWSDLSTIKGDLSNEILANLNIMVTKNAEQVNVTGNPEAYEYYLKGQYKFDKRTTLEDLKISQGMLEQAITLDSNLVSAINLLGTTYNFENNYDKSEEIFKKAKDVSLRLNNMVAHSTAIGGLAVINYFRGEIDDALGLMLEAKSIAEEAGDKGQVSRNLNNISLIYSARGDNQQALKTLFEMRELAESLGDKFRLVYAHQNLAAVYSRLGKQDTSKQHTLIAYQLAKEIGDLNMQASALTNIAVGKVVNKQYEDALMEFNQILEIFDKMGDNMSVVKTLHRITMTYSYMHKDEDAVETSERALNLSKELKDDLLISESYIYLGAAHNELGKKSEGFESLKKSKKIYQNRNNQDGLGKIAGLIANHFQETGDLDSAMHYIKESFMIHEELGNKSQILQNVSFMAGLYLQKGNIELAMDQTDQAMAISKEINDDMRYHYYHLGKGLIYFQQKDYAQAMDGNMSKWYKWFTENGKDISLREMAIYLCCLKKLNRDYDLSRLETLMKETPERKYHYKLNYMLYQLYDDRSYLKSSYEKIMDIKSKLDDKTGEEFINYPLESEIVNVYKSIS
ncbi:MAG: adenylate/guanylate cyclase domain-containing protein [Candidatus Neomarinimicrobiota bacterium]